MTLIAQQLRLYADYQPRDPQQATHPGNLNYRRPRLSVEHAPLPRLTADSVRVKMRYAGICGTDLHAVQADGKTGYLQSSAPMHIPPQGRVLGHEGVGQIIEKGAGVQGLNIGDYVAFESILACAGPHYCPPCASGHPNQCDHAQLLGMELDGLFGDYAQLPARLCHPINRLAGQPAGLEMAALLEPMAVACLACEQAQLPSGARVLIFGGGPIGAGIARLCRQIYQAKCLHLVEPSALRRALSDPWVDQTDTPEHFAPLGEYDAVFECSGVLDNIQGCLAQVAAQGKIILLARSGAPLVLSSVDPLISRNIALIGVRGHLGGSFGRVLGWLESGRLDLSGMITGRVQGLSALKAWMQDPQRLVAEHLKLLVDLWD
jgi:(R,R)-butanediol dehydrogenase/meso-butanediol dehydrogenase/diacetyl reductase